MKIEDAEIQDLKTFDVAYFAGEPIIPDVQYDKLKKELQEKYPDNPYFLEVGASTIGEKVDLPYPMGSLNQVYEGDTAKWILKYNLQNQSLIVTEKLDGVSVLLVYEKSGTGAKLKKAYSRGNGVKGEDITRHILKIPSVPKSVKAEYAAIRAEIIMKNDTFEKNHSKNYKNPRNMVAGVINRKEPTPNHLKDIDVVAYELIDSSGVDAFTKRDTLDLLKEWGFSIAADCVYTGQELTSNTADATLSDVLTMFKNDGNYELDGIVITVNDYSVFEDVSKSSSLNPEHSVKFKVTDEDSIVETDVVNVHWKISKSGFCKPRVEIKPVELLGSTITFATGFNAKFIADNGIGKGAKIRITKAGSVIPYIVEVTRKVDPKMPDLYWEWDENNVEAVVDNTTEQTFMKVVHFFKTIEVENAQETSLAKIVKDQNLTKEDFTTIIYELICLFDVEWKRTLGENGMKVYDSFYKKMSNMKPEVLMGATPFFGRGFGVRKAKKVLDQISYDEFRNANYGTINSLEGFNTTAQTVYNGIKDYNYFVSKIGFALKYKEDEVVDDNLKDEVIVMTGFRDKELQDKIESRGGKVTTSVSKKTTKVIAQDVNSSSSKVKKARDLGIEVISQRDFNYSYIS